MSDGGRSDDELDESTSSSPSFCLSYLLSAVLMFLVFDAVYMSASDSPFSPIIITGDNDKAVTSLCDYMGAPPVTLIDRLDVSSPSWLQLIWDRRKFGAPHLLYKAAFIYLITPYESDIKELKLSLSSVWENVLQLQHHYQIYLIYTKDDKQQFTNTNRTGQVNLFDELLASLPCSSSCISFHEVEFRYPPGFDNRTRGEFYNFKRNGWSYSNMIRFWAKSIWDEPFLQQLDYYIRLDTDSFIHSKFRLDPIVWMKCAGGRSGDAGEVATTNAAIAIGSSSSSSSGSASMSVHSNESIASDGRREFIYGYISIGRDPGFVVRTLYQFAYNYSVSHSLSLSPSFPNFRWPSDVDTNTDLSVPIFYNNLEVVNTRWFRSAKVREWIDALDTSHGMYVRRWGDAPQRFLTLLLFSDPQHQPLLIQFKYHHQFDVDPTAIRDFEF